MNKVIIVGSSQRQICRVVVNGYSNRIFRGLYCVGAAKEWARKEFDVTGRIEVFESDQRDRQDN